MPRRAVPAEVAETASAHLRTHGLDEFDERQIGRPGAGGKTVAVTWDEDPALGLYIRCRRCPDGFDRYLVAFERPDPTEHLYGLIGRHFADHHPGISFSVDAIYHQHNRPKEKLATFMPMVAQRGAGILCAHCPDGLNHRQLTPPPYLDARRLQLRLSDHPDRREQTRGLTSREQADHLEAWDRGLLQKRERHAGSAALKEAKAKAAALSPIEQALASLLRQRVDQGERITHVIEQLARQAKDDPTAFACAIGEALPEFAALARKATAREFAAEVTAMLGGRPTTSKTTLWNVWAKAK